MAAARPSHRVPRDGDRDPVDRAAGGRGTGRSGPVGFAGRRRAVDDGRRDRRVPARGSSGCHDPDRVRRRERIPGRRDAAALSSDRTWRPDHRGGTCAAETGQLLRSIPRATRRVGHPRRPVDGGAGAAHRSRHVAGGLAPRCRRVADPRAPRTRGGTGRRDPHRPARPRRPAGRGRLHDRRRQSRRGDLGLEHRDRGGRRRGDGRSTRSSATSDRHRHRGRLVHRVRRGLAIGAPCRGDGRGGPPRPGVRPKRPGRRGPRSGGIPVAPRGAGARERRRVPAVDARHRGSRGLGDAADGSAGSPDPWTTAPLVERKPRRLAGGPGGDPPGRARLVRAAGAHLAGREPGGRATGHAGHGCRPRGAARRCPGERRRARGAWCGPRGTGLDRIAPDDRDRRGRGRDPVRQHRVRAGRRCGAGRRERGRGPRRGPGSEASAVDDAVGSLSPTRRARRATCRRDRTDREPAHRGRAARPR